MPITPFEGKPQKFWKWLSKVASEENADKSSNFWAHMLTLPTGHGGGGGGGGTSFPSSQEICVCVCVCVDEW